MSYTIQQQTPYGTVGDPNNTWRGVGGFPAPISPSAPFPQAPQSSPQMPGGFPTPFSLGGSAPMLPATQFQDLSQPNMQTSAYGGASNSTQRWQEAALAGAKPLSSARIFSDMYDGRRIDGRAPQSSRDTTPSGIQARVGQAGQGGFTPQVQWDSQFKGGQIFIPKTTTPSKYSPNY